MTRAELDAAVPGLARPRIEALLRSLPKDARRSLIPIAGAAQEFLASVGVPSDTQKLADWLRESRGIPAPLIRFASDAIPPHLTPQVAVVDDVQELARGSDLIVLRRNHAARARAALERHARMRFPAPWARFDAESLPLQLALEVDGGSVQVFPTLAVRDDDVYVEFEWSAAEALRILRHGLCRLAQKVLPRHARDLTKALAADAALQLASSPFLRGEALAEVILELTFRQACFAHPEPPRSRLEFEAALERGRERLYPCFEEVKANIATWLAEARTVRRSASDPRARLLPDAARESDTHLARLLDPKIIVAQSDDTLRQWPRYLRAEERRWQRLCARGSESPHILRELTDWAARAEGYESRTAAELRWIPELAEFQFWIEEYRISLYAQELRTLAPISAARLSARAADLEAWLTR